MKPILRGVFSIPVGFIAGVNNLYKRDSVLAENITFILKSVEYFYSCNFYVKNIPTWMIGRIKAIRLPSIDNSARRKLERIFSVRLSASLDISVDDVYKGTNNTIDSMRYVPFNRNISYELLLSVCVNVIRQLNISAGSVIPPEFVSERLPKDTSSCYPAFSKKGDPSVIASCSSELSDMMSKSNPFELIDSLFRLPTVTFHRFVTKFSSKNSVTKQLKTKIRTVFGVPCLISYLETSLLQSTIDNINSRFLITKVNRSALSSRLRQFGLRAYQSKKLIFATDIAMMDSSISPIFLIILFSSFMVNSKYKAQLCALCIYHLFSPIIRFNGDVTCTVGGNLSGTKITTLINTFTLLATFQYWSVLTNGRYLDEGEILICGDDCIMMVDKNFDLETLSIVLSWFNLKLKQEATSLSSPDQPFEFLGFTWVNFEPDNPIAWLIRKVVYAEKGSLDDEVLSLARLCSIAFQTKTGYKFMVKHIAEFTPVKFIYDVENRRDINAHLLNGDKVCIPISRLFDLGWRMF
jgi:hypothetical protein